MNLDCHSVKSEDGVPLSGDQAARILDLAGIVVNRNTIPGDRSAFNPAGIRMGTSWVTQRGFGEQEILRLADIVADVLFATKPYVLPSRKQGKQRSKVDFSTLQKAKMQVRDLAINAGIDYEPKSNHYPHFYYLDDYVDTEDKCTTFEIGGERVREYLNYVLDYDLDEIEIGDHQHVSVFTPQGKFEGILSVASENVYQLTASGDQAGLAAAWLRDLSDGFVEFDRDLTRKIPGPVWVKDLGQIMDLQEFKELISTERNIGKHKPYYIGISEDSSFSQNSLPTFEWAQDEPNLQQTPIFNTHKNLGAKLIPFAGWEMPVWYSSVVDEHQAVREAAGLFDVAHMGVYQAEGIDAAVFLDCVVGNDVGGLGIGKSLYTHFLDPNGDVIDDLLVYRRSAEKFLIVVNASNDDKDWAWLNAVKQGEVRVDNQRPWSRAFGREVIIRNLRDPSEGEDMRVDIALQGPKSREILLALGCDRQTRKRIEGLKWAELCEVVISGFDLVVSRTGYTGERIAFELFVHPDQANALFEKLLEIGSSSGLKPCGLGARDSLRTEAGLPLYGHEMGGELNLGVGEAGFGDYVKIYKPWFIGRDAFVAQEKTRKGAIIRFRFNDRGVRIAHLGDPIVEKRGRVIGKVTSCAIDTEGFLTGQAMIDLKYSTEGTPIFIYQSASKKTSKAPAELNLGDRTILPTPAVVLSRFPKRR
jgi:glycine hydroxymethyltransferase